MKRVSADSAPNSAIMTGKLRHTRLAPRRREFSYPVYMLYLDLAEAGRAFSGSRLFGTRRRSPVSFRREDFYGDPSRPLDEEIRNLVLQHTGTRPDGPIRLLANMRTFGFQFNPIAVYYCFAPDGERLTHVVADVTNIPWRESRAYVFETGSDGRTVDGTAAKQMHVSPFLEMDYTYRLRTAAPTDRLRLTVANMRAGAVEFTAGLSLERRRATAANLRRTLLRFPAMSASVVARIFWQALKMRLAGFRWFPHADGSTPAPPDRERVSRGGG